MQQYISDVLVKLEIWHEAIGQHVDGKQHIKVSKL